MKKSNPKKPAVTTFKYSLYINIIRYLHLSILPVVIGKTMDLPIKNILKDVESTLKSHNRLIITAPPGSGKSTVLPLYLLNSSLLSEKKIILLEPRRLAVKSIAGRMAQLISQEPGQDIGYRIRLEKKISPQTRLEVVTEGILTRMIQEDNALEKIGLIIFDEFHERNLQADLALALCLQIQQVLRPDLKIIVMSATIDTNALSKTLKAPVVSCEGKMHPVEISYGEDNDLHTLSEQCARIIKKAVENHPGDCLAFLPGEGEIKKCEEILLELLPDFSIHPLYGMLSMKEQQLAILPNKNKRKIVLATSIAETSLTIEGVTIVVDSGYTRRNRFDNRSGMNRLETLRISKDSADQRSGRAGRLQNGVCYRMWSLATHQRLTEQRIPEIAESDLCVLALELLKWGVVNPNELSWIDKPPASNYQAAVQTLVGLEAIQEDKITLHGKNMHRLGCHPRIAHMLLSAQNKEEKSLACDISAVLENRDPFYRTANTDITIRIEELRKRRKEKQTGGSWGIILQTASYYHTLIQAEESTQIADHYRCGLLISTAYPERTARKKENSIGKFQLANGKTASMEKNDNLAHEEWLGIAQVDLRDTEGKIFLAAPIEPQQIKSKLSEQEKIFWNNKEGVLQASMELKLGNLVVESKPLPNPNPEEVKKVIYTLIKNDWEQLLHLSDRFLNLQNRILSLSLWNPEELWPDCSSEKLFKNPEKWLAPYLNSIKRKEDFKAVDLYTCLFFSLSPLQQQLLDEKAPEKIKVPSGSFISLRYYSDGKAPVLSVRLQEVFGLLNTPLVNGGKIKVILHLLSPGYKPVQVTSDLKSFWNGLYFEVKKELQRRYPKHSWPENPMDAKAIAKGKSTK